MSLKNPDTKTVTLKHNGLTVTCRFAGNGRLGSKIEHWCGKTAQFSYGFDERGHLLKVLRDGMVVEEYRYNQNGQRIEQWREWRGISNSTDGLLRYDTQGRLIRAGNSSYAYDRNGALAARHGWQDSLHLTYGQDTMPDRVVLPSGEVIRYAYDLQNPLGPARRYKNDVLTAEYQWKHALCLSAYRDHEHGLNYTFSHNNQGLLHTVHIAPLPPDARQPEQPAWKRDWTAESANWLATLAARTRCDRLHELFKRHGGSLNLMAGCDQVGTVRILTNDRGVLIKEMLRDSFGRLLHDSLPDLFMPIGFAGGLTDPDTGLVRFGWRDYDPAVGRFTAPDPARDTRGDGDIYDYCVDDPVRCVDPEGLSPWNAWGHRAIQVIEKSYRGATQAVATAIPAINSAAKAASEKAVDAARQARIAWDTVKTPGMEKSVQHGLELIDGALPVPFTEGTPMRITGSILGHPTTQQFMDDVIVKIRPKSAEVHIENPQEKTSGEQPRDEKGRFAHKK